MNPEFASGEGSSKSQMEMKQQTQPGSEKIVWETQGHLVNTIKEKLSRLGPSHFSPSKCIYTVEARLGNLKDEAFTPRLVSVGPLHRGKPHLQFMEDYKLRCLKRFLLRKIDILAIINFIVMNEMAIRQYYQDKIELCRKEFCEMILLDSVFLVELLLQNNETELLLQNQAELILEDNEDQWRGIELLRDMMLLENQLPLFVPEAIYAQSLGLTVGNLRFGDLIHNYMKSTCNVPKWDMQVLPRGSLPPRHLVEYLWMSQLHEVLTERGKVAKGALGSETAWKLEAGDSRSATDMLEAGIMFGTVYDHYLLHITFNKGILSIPRLELSETTEAFFRNLIAFERCEHVSPRYICEYITFMNSLIKTGEDVDILIKYGIIENRLGETNQIAELFHDLHMATSMTRTTYFSKLLYDVNEYSRNFWRHWMATYRWSARWSGWMVMLRRDYFNNPWSGISVIAATFALFLTAVQTVFSVTGAPKFE